MEILAHIFVRGKVQGVCYRAFTRELAQQLGLNGFCRNLRDGRVEVRAQGQRNSVEAMIGRLHEGPPDALIEDVEVIWEPAEKPFADFSIRYE